MSAKDRPVILAVDDSEDLLALMERALRTLYTVVTAGDGGAAIVAAEGEPRPDLILLDVDMPEVSGFEVCRALKAETRTADIPVIFLTSRSEAESQVEGLESGASDYVTKPINGKVLLARVRMQLALADRRLELERLVQERTAQLENTRTELIRRLGRAMQMHESAAVGNRVMRLGHYAKLISQAAGAKPQVCELMHDRRAAARRRQARRARPRSCARTRSCRRRTGSASSAIPRIGAEIIGEHDDPLLKVARQMALTHHENWDGTGYPEGPERRGHSLGRGA